MELLVLLLGMRPIETVLLDISSSSGGGLGTSRSFTKSFTNWINLFIPRSASAPRPWSALLLRMSRSSATTRFIWTFMLSSTFSSDRRFP
jgi:hypothetical protein